MDSAQQICIDAAIIAKGKGMLGYAGRFLQSTLNDLSLHRNLKINLTSVPITLNGTTGPFNLPQNYLRPYDFWFSVGGEPYELDEVDLAMYDSYFQNPSVAAYPAKFATDLRGLSAIPATVPLLYVYPQSSASLVATLRYFLKQPELAAPLESNANIPWFEDQDYLRMDVARQMMGITGDDRMAEFLSMCENQLRKHLLMEGDEQKVAKYVKLDPNRYRSGVRARATKSTVF